MEYNKDNKLKVVTLCSDEWKPISGYDGIYEVSIGGLVRSVKRKVWNGHAFVQLEERLLKPNTLSKGYLQVTLYNNRRRKCFQVHRLVASAFIENPDNLPQVNHINGNKKDNRVENLEWCDNSMNQLHAWKTGLQKPHYCGGGAPKKRVAMLDDNGNVEREFDSIRAASIYVGCSTPSNLSHHLNGKCGYKSIMGRKFRFV